jgi:hypothetical protein
MATSDRTVEFGSVLDKGGSDTKLWLLILPAVALLVALIGWAVVQGSKAGDIERRARAAELQAADLQNTVAERDRLLGQARSEEAFQKSPGQALALFYGVNPRARESGVAFAYPDQHAVRVYYYGLATPPAGQEYVVAARTTSGEAKALGAIVPGNDGTGYLLAKDVPDGTSAIELAFRPQNEQSMDKAEPRISARYPASGERGVLVETPAQARQAPPQARRGARR